MMLLKNNKCLLLLLAFEPKIADGFLCKNPNPTSALHAKGRAGGGGGFGTPKKAPKIEDDYALFPKLDPNILATLIPSDATTFSGEIYQRLEQIYGFPDFNYDTPASSTTTSLLQDLITLSESPTLDSSFTMFDNLPAFADLQVLHVDPLVISISNFFTADECERYMGLSTNTNSLQSRSPTVGKDAVAKAQRTSTTWYHPFASVPELMVKASRLLGLNSIDCWEEPQTVRYRPKEKFTWHLDALGPTEKQDSQRIATLLVYLTDLSPEDGGATLFRDLQDEHGQRLSVRPAQGTALLFFPAAGGLPETPYDIRTLHCGQQVVSGDKWIAQLWLRERPYVPTAPPGNRHAQAMTAMEEYCRLFS
jgi:hypothetical protein